MTFSHESALLPGAEFIVAIDGKGLWPNLTLAPNGEIWATVYNHPSHGYGPDSGIELWVSSDEGRSFQFRSVASNVDDCPGGIRMNHAAGLNAKGELIVLVSGYHAGQSQPMLPTQCCRSTDGGMTWTRKTLSESGVPFGNIVDMNGKLLCAVYEIETVGADKGARSCRSSLLASDDDGATWRKTDMIAEDVNETFLMVHSDGRLFASGRSVCVDKMDGVLPHGSGERLFISNDDGSTWSGGRLMSPQGQENAHLLELRDGRILYCFTSRIPGLFGVVYRISEDRGETWSAARPLITIPAMDWRKTDCGYPSSVQLADGTVVTAFYFGPKAPEYAAETTPWHQRYHMGIARWRP